MEAESTARIPRADVERYHAAAVEMADEARRIVEPAIERGFEVETKPDASLVTDIDHAVERRFRELIGRWFPDHGVIGEEYPPTHPESAFQWILDPIDGTEEFVHGVPTFGTMLGLHYRGCRWLASSITRRLPSGCTREWAWARTGTASESVSPTRRRACVPKACDSS